MPDYDLGSLPLSRGNESGIGSLRIISALYLRVPRNPKGSESSVLY